MLALERRQGKDSLYRRLPHAMRVAITFGIICIAWVFFRATTLSAAGRYLGAMFAAGDPGIAADILRGALYTPYHLLMLAIAAALVWGAPQTSYFTHRLSWPRAAFCFALLLASVAVMWTQTSNPFLYFQF